MELIDVFMWVGIGSIVVACLVVVAVGCHAISTQGESVSYSSSRPVQTPNPSPTTTPAPVQQTVPEGYVDTGNGQWIYTGAPVWFQPEFESTESIYRRMYNEEEFMQLCWNPKIIEQLEKGDEVKRQVLWLCGKGETTGRIGQDFLEGMYWLEKQDGEDFIVWYNRYLQRQRDIVHKAGQDLYEKEFKPKMDEIKAQPDFVAVYTNKDGTKYKEIYKDGQKKREYF